MTTTLRIEQTVGELVAEQPGCSQVFEKLGIDYCCGGRLTLAEACSRKGLDPAAVLLTLQSVQQPNEGSTIRPRAMSLTALADHIEATHHVYLKQELPRLTQLAAKVASRHGDNHAWLRQLEPLIETFAQELDGHMAKEEGVLFPLIRRLDAGQPAGRTDCGMTLDQPIAVMMREHDDAGRALERMREMSDNYQPPTDACNSFHALLDGLATLERDMHQHIHLENNALFPRAMEKAGL